MRKPLPKKIAEAPGLDLGLELYWDAFWDLSTCRPSGFGAAPIPWLAIRDYAMTFGFDDEQQEDLYHLTRKMDNAFLEYHANKNGDGTCRPGQTSDNSRKGWSSTPER